LQIGEIDGVRIADRERSNAGRGQELRRRRAQATRADDQRMRRGEPGLGIDAKLGKQNVATVAKELRVIHVGSRA
jgi:hypothetical protein